jgi:hypothetical protein
MTDLPRGLVALAAVQDDLLTRQQALSLMSLAALRHRLRTEWRIVLPGVYGTNRDALTDRQKRRASVLYAGPSAQLADCTSLVAHGVRDVPRVGSQFILIPATEHRASKGFVVVRRTHRLPEPATIGSLPYCPVARSLTDAAARIGDLQTGRALIADAVQRRLVGLDDLSAEVPHLVGRGAGIARRAVQDVLAGGRSAPECEFVDLCAGVRGLPRPLPNALIQLPDGRKISPDALWEGARLIHETNSRRHHDGEDDFESTQARAAAVTTAGFVVISSTPRQIRQEGARIAGQVHALHRANVGRGLPTGVVILRRCAT